MILEFTKAVTLLLALCLIQGFIARRWSNKELFGQALSGLLFGSICVVGMMNPIEVTPGVIFDARSVVLSMSGLFGGPVVGGVAAVMAGGYRAWLGGGGAPVGVSVVISCVVLGLAYRYWHQRGWLQIGIIQLFAFGLLVHLVEVFLFTFLPDEVVATVMRNIAVPLIVTFTPATVLLGKLLYSIESQIQTETALIESENKLHDFAEAGSDWFWEMDENLRFSYFSENFTKITGVPHSALLGKTRMETGITGVDPELWKNHLADLDAHRPFRDFRHPRILPDGRRVFLSINGKAIFDHAGNFQGYRGTGSDITEKMESEEALRQSAASLAEAQRLTNIGNWRWSIERDELLSCSEEYARIYGVSVDEIHDHMKGQMTQIIHPDDRLRYAKFAELVDQEERDYEIEYHIVRPDGKIRIVRELGEVIFDENGKAIEDFGTIQDVTELREAQAKLLQSQKLEALGQLTGGIAHDFNNLLSVVLGNLQLAEKLTAQDERITEWIRSAIEATDRGSDLVERLLAFSRKQALDAKIIDANELLISMQELLSRTLGEEFDVTIGTADDLWLTKADPGQLETALLNLAINARDAMVGGGTVKIETANIHVDDVGHASQIELKAGDYVLISVCDEGVGISPDIIGEVFQPFFTTKSPGEGSGLGLSMVYGFARQSGGSIEVSSDVGQGTTVKLYLPRTTAAKSDALTAVANVEKPVGGGETILVVEDDLAVRKVAVSLLEELGYQVLKAKDGPSAMAALKDEQVDLLFSDIIMPGGMRGDELANLACEHNSNLKVLHCSGCGQHMESQSDTAPPSHAVLKKPYRIEELASAVRQILDS